MANSFLVIAKRHLDQLDANGTFNANDAALLSALAELAKAEEMEVFNRNFSLKRFN